MTFPFCDPDHIIGTFFSTDIYMSRGKPDSGPMHGDVSMFLNANDNGFVGNLNSFGNQPLSKEESVSFSASSEPSRLLDPRLEGSKQSMGAVYALKELVRSQELKHLRFFIFVTPFK
jgi:RNA polymerase II C-terminal domain phosphatase-like 1/2